MSDLKPGLSPNSAAEMAGVSRPTIMKAIKTGKIKAEKRNSGWDIDAESLSRWMQGRRKGKSEADISSYMQDDMQGFMQLQTQNAELRGEIKALKAQVDALQNAKASADADRDRWAAQADNLTKAIEASNQAKAEANQHRVGWFDRLLGRG